MSHRRKLEQVLDLLINEEQEKAEEILHQIMVEKARAAYDALMEDEDEDEDLGSEDFRADFADEIEAAHDEIDSDEEGHDEHDAEDHDEDEDEDLEDKVSDIESDLEELQAAFDELVLGIDGDEELADDDLEDLEDFDADEEEDELEFSFDDEEAIEEATKLQHPVKDVPNQEGEFAGTGDHSKKGATGTEAPYTHAPKRTETEGEEVDFAGGDEKGAKADQGKDHTPSSNVDVDHEDTGHDADKQKDGKAKAGTGDRSAHGEVGKESALGGTKSPRGA